jgi:hypothetical protein
MSSRNNNVTRNGAAPCGGEADDLRDLIREAHGAAKDLRQAIAEARRIIREELDRESVRMELDDIAKEVAANYTEVARRLGDEANAAIRETELYRSSIRSEAKALLERMEKAADDPLRILTALKGRPLPATFAAPPGMVCSWCDCKIRCHVDDNHFVHYVGHNESRCEGCDANADYIITGTSEKPLAMCARHSDAYRDDIVNAISENETRTRR